MGRFVAEAQAVNRINHPNIVHAYDAGIDGRLEVPAQEIGAVIVGDLGEAWNFTLLNRAFAYLMAAQRPRLIALGMTRYWQAAEGLRLDVAPFVVALAHAADVEPLVTGKPDPAFFDTALSMLGVQAGQAVMIGDDIHSDIEGAQRAGLRALLMRTGKYRAQYRCAAIYAPRPRHQCRVVTTCGRESKRKRHAHGK